MNSIPENLVAKLSPIHLSKGTQEQKEIYNFAYNKFLDKSLDLEHKKDLAQYLENALMNDFSELENWYDFMMMNKIKKEKSSLVKNREFV